MTRDETTQILEYCQQFDNRKITDGMVLAWAEVLEHIPFDIGRQAVVAAFQAEEIKWLDPRAIIKFAKPILDRQKAATIQEQAHAEAEAAKAQSTPMPVCRHGKGLPYCGPCSKAFATAHKTHPVADIRVCNMCLTAMRNPVGLNS